MTRRHDGCCTSQGCRWKAVSKHKRGSLAKDRRVCSGTSCAAAAAAAEAPPAQHLQSLAAGCALTRPRWQRCSLSMETRVLCSLHPCAKPPTCRSGPGGAVVPPRGPPSPSAAAARPLPPSPCEAPATVAALHACTSGAAARGSLERQGGRAGSLGEAAVPAASLPSDGAAWRDLASGCAATRGSHLPNVAAPADPAVVLLLQQQQQVGGACLLVSRRKAQARGSPRWPRRCCRWQGAAEPASPVCPPARPSAAGGLKAAAVRAVEHQAHVGGCSEREVRCALPELPQAVRGRDCKLPKRPSV